MGRERRRTKKKGTTTQRGLPLRHQPHAPRNPGLHPQHATTHRPPRNRRAQRTPFAILPLLPPTDHRVGPNYKTQAYASGGDELRRFPAARRDEPGVEERAGGGGFAVCARWVGGGGL